MTTRSIQQEPRITQINADGFPGASLTIRENLCPSVAHILDWLRRDLNGFKSQPERGCGHFERSTSTCTTACQFGEGTQKK
jgi:hypothetical protein